MECPRRRNITYKEIGEIWFMTVRVMRSCLLLSLLPQGQYQNFENGIGAELRLTMSPLPEGSSPPVKGGGGRGRHRRALLFLWHPGRSEE